MPLFGKKKEEQRSQPVRKSIPRVARIERVVWLGLKVADILGESIFLENTLQLRFADEGNSGEGHHIRYNCGKIELELVDGGMTWVSRPRPKNGSPDIPLIASFVVDDIHKLVEELSEKEVLVTQIFDQDWAASALFFDPERNIWQIEELRTLPAIGTNRLEHINTVWLECQDLEKQVTFYKDMLQMPMVAAGGGTRPVTFNTEAERRHPHVERAPSQFEYTDPMQETPVEQVSEDAIPDSPEKSSAETVEKVVAEPLDNTYKSPPEIVGLDPLPLDTPEEIEASMIGQNPAAAIFFDEAIHFALVPGGRKPEGVQQRKWGSDVNLSLSFQSYDVMGLALKLREAGYTVTSPTPDPDARRGLSFTFTDPEGNVWQVAEWPRLPF